MPETPEGPTKKTSWAQIESMVQLGIVLPAATFLGWLAGTGLDHWLHTKWLYLPGLLLGTVAGFIHLIRTVLSAESK